MQADRNQLTADLLIADKKLLVAKNRKQVSGNQITGAWYRVAGVR